MKIRSYRGPSLEGLYDTIHKELGPEAVVVRKDEAGGGVGRLFGRRRYELIAVVDDGSADSHVLADAAKSAELRKLSALCTEKWQQMEEKMDGLRQELRGGSTNGLRFGAGAWSVPDFAADWDPRFVDAVAARAPGLLQGDGAIPGAEIAGLLNVEEHFDPKRSGAGPHIVVLTGPTGSGKTTTLAKLAAHWRLDRGLKVGLITTDTYRIAAVDQTREYATLLGMELRVVFSAAEASRAVASFADRDVILVDTPGRSYRDDVGMSGLSGMLKAMGGATVFLLVPATLDRFNCCEMLRRFQALHPDYVVLTKTDEAGRAPALTAIAGEMRQPIAFVTDGQRVPQDIRPARRSELVELLVGSECARTTKSGGGARGVRTPGAGGSAAEAGMMEMLLAGGPA